MLLTLVCQLLSQTYDGQSCTGTNPGFLIGGADLEMFLGVTKKKIKKYLSFPSAPTHRPCGF